MLGGYVIVATAQSKNEVAGLAQATEDEGIASKNCPVPRVSTNRGKTSSSRLVAAVAGTEL